MVSDFGDILDPLPLQSAQQAGRNDDRFPFHQLRFDLIHDRRVERGAFRQQDGRRFAGKFRHEIDRDADHPQIGVKKILPGRVVGLIAFKADRLSQLAHKTIDLFQRVSGRTGIGSRLDRGAVRLDDRRHHRIEVEACLLPLPRSAFRRSHLPEHLAEIKKRDFRRFGKERQPQLLGIAVQVAPSIGIHPPAAVAARFEVFKIPEDGIAQIFLEVLIAGSVARFGAGVDAVEEFWLGFQIEAQALEMLIPVRVLDHHLNFWIDRFRRLDDEVARGFIQQIEPETSPAFGSLGADAVFTLAVGKEKIVEDDFVEQPGSEFHDFLELLPMLRIGIAVGFKPVSLVHRDGDAARRANTPVLEKSLELQDGFFVRDDHVAMGFEVNLVDL